MVYEYILCSEAICTICTHIGNFEITMGNWELKE